MPYTNHKDRFAPCASAAAPRGSGPLVQLGGMILGHARALDVARRLRVAGVQSRVRRADRLYGSEWYMVLVHESDWHASEGLGIHPAS